MHARAFIDTNILVYAYTSTEPAKKEAALSHLDNCRPIVSTQTLKEFTNVLLKKTNLTIEEIKVRLDRIKDTAEIIEESLELIRKALDICERYGFSFYDSLIVAAAQFSKCDMLYSENMQNLQTIDGRLIIINPLQRTKP
jgi:predicted nucleic acid-binding protein